MIHEERESRYLCGDSISIRATAPIPKARAEAPAVEAALAGAASITIVNRDSHRGLELVKLIQEKTPARADLVVWDKMYRVPEEQRSL